MTIDAVASEPHFIDHILPIWLALPPAVRGSFFIPGRPSLDLPGIVHGMPPVSRTHTLVASIGDLKRAHGRTIALMEHGCGQSFGGEPRSGNFSSYAGGSGRDASLFLHPGPHPAARDRARYPDARVDVVGCAKLDDLPRKARSDKPVVAISFHWNCAVCPETRPAYRERTFQTKLASLAHSGLTVIGHGHPREMRRLRIWYRRIGVEVVETFAEVCARADVYVNDASSTLFEFASTGRPVVVLNPRMYRRDVNHGLRFWEASTVGVNVNPADDLEDAVRLALEDGVAQQAERERCVGLVYAYRDGAAQRAADVLVDWASGRSAAAA